MTDRLVRGLLPASGIRFAICETAELCSEAIGRLHTDWVSGFLLSEALTCATLLSVGLKDEERLTLRWAYPGPIGTILADMNEKAEVRGFPQNTRLAEDVVTLDQALGGAGMISGITSFPGRIGRQGTVEGVFKDITRDLGHFMSLSFQIETALTVGLIMPPREPIKISSSTGILLQPLPGCDLEEFEKARRAVEAPTFREWLEAFPRRPEELLEWLEIGEKPQFLGEVQPAFVCNCSRKKVVSVLRMLDPEELRDMVEKEGQAEVNCHFCAKTYYFSRSDLQILLQQSEVGHG